MKQIKRAELRDLLLDTNGKMFSVKFIKKNGEDRHMVCRLNVTKHLKGGDQGYNPAEFNLLTVWEANVNKWDYRNINLETCYHAKVAGEEYEVID